MQYKINTKVSFVTVGNTVNIKFGEKIRELRKLNMLSQEELADRAKLHRTYIGMIERAEKNITLVNIQKLAMALNVEISDLFREIQRKWLRYKNC